MAKKKRNAWQWFVRVIAGYEVMILCTLLLLVTVFFSTLEQAEVGLYTVKRYYLFLFLEPTGFVFYLPLI